MRQWSVGRLVLLVHFILLSTAWATPKAKTTAPPEFYDEVNDPVTGAPREAYGAALPVYRSFSKERLDEIQATTRAGFKGDYALSPLPRLLTKEEADFLERAIKQRATTLRMFLQDHYSGKKSYLASKIIPEKVIDRIRKRNWDHLYDGIISPTQISFPYGVDIMRDAKGVWRVLEDNIGPIGGMGDLPQARKLLFDAIPEYSGVVKPLDDPKTFYDEIMNEMKARANPPGSKVVILTMSPYYDSEDPRLHKELMDRGAEFVTQNTKSYLSSDKDGVWVNKPGADGKNTKVRAGYVFLPRDHTMYAWPVRWGERINWYVEGQVDSEIRKPRISPIERAELQKFLGMSNPNKADLKRVKGLLQTRGKLSVEDLKGLAKERLEKTLLKSEAAAIAEALTLYQHDRRNPEGLERLKKALGVSGWKDIRKMASRQRLLKDVYQRILDGAIPTNVLPGIESVSDKEFYIYMEKLTRFYLKEEPLLRNVETHRFTKGPQDKPVLDEGKLTRFLAEKEKWVFKDAVGRAGDGVWVGALSGIRDMRRAEKAIRGEPSQYLAQRFTPMSRQLNNFVDIRGLAQVFPDKVVFSPTFWGRSTPVNRGKGKVNISTGGTEVAVATVDPKDCKPSIDLLTH